MEQLRTEVCECAALYALKYEEEFAPHAPAFVTAVWTVLLATGPQPKYDAVSILNIIIINYIFLFSRKNYRNQLTIQEEKDMWGKFVSVLGRICMTNNRLLLTPASRCWGSLECNIVVWFLYYMVYKLKSLIIINVINFTLLVRLNVWRSGLNDTLCDPKLLLCACLFFISIFCLFVPSTQDIFLARDLSFYYSLICYYLSVGHLPLS